MNKKNMENPKNIEIENEDNTTTPPLVLSTVRVNHLTPPDMVTGKREGGA